MQQSKLYKTFSALKAWEIHHLKLFLASPYFNKRSDVVALFEQLSSEEAGSKEALFEQIYPSTPYDDQKMRLLSSRLYKLIEQFLACRELLTDEVRLGFAQANALRKLGLERGFVKSLKQTARFIEGMPIRNATYLQHAYELEQVNYQYSISQTRSQENNLQAMCNSLDLYFMAAKLRQGCFILSQQAVYRQTYDQGLLDYVLAYTEERPEVLEEPAIGIYYYCYRALTDSVGEAYFVKFRELIARHQDRFSATEIRDLYLLAINYCIRQLNVGNQAYVKEGFEMYRSGLEGRYLIDQNGLTPFTFKNAVALGLSQQEFEWVESFILNYKQFLPQRHRQSSYLYNLAKLRQAQGHYSEAMPLLIRFDSSDYLLNLGAKTMLLKMYYELAEFDALDSLLESMRVYLKRKEVLGYHKEHFKNIVQFTRKLMQLAEYDEVGRQRLQARILATDIRSEKEWFLDQLAKKG